MITIIEDTSSHIDYAVYDWNLDNNKKILCALVSGEWFVASEVARFFENNCDELNRIVKLKDGYFAIKNNVTGNSTRVISVAVNQLLKYLKGIGIDSVVDM